MWGNMCATMSHDLPPFVLNPTYPGASIAARAVTPPTSNANTKTTRRETHATQLALHLLSLYYFPGSREQQSHSSQAIQGLQKNCTVPSKPLAQKKHQMDLEMWLRMEGKGYIMRYDCTLRFLRGIILL